MNAKARAKPSLASIVADALLELARQSPDPTYVEDADGRLLYVNDAAAEAIGRPPDDILGHSLPELFEAGSAGEVLRVDAAILESGDAVQLEERIVFRDGTVRDLLTTKVRGPGAVPVIAGYSRDISAERATSARLERSRAELERLLMLLPVGILVVRERRLVLINERLARMLGGVPDDFLGRDYLELVHPAERASVAERIASYSLPGARPTVSERRLLHRDGSEILTEVTPMAVVEIEGRTAQLAVYRDITDERNVQQRLVLTDRLASVGTLAAGAAHEINNPLAVIRSTLGFATEALEELSGEADLRADLADALSEATEAVDRVRAIVGGLQTFAGRGDDATIEPLDLRDLLEETTAIADPQIRRRARLERDYREVPPVRANPSALRQLFLNLISNAVEALPAGHAAEETIRISTSTTEDGRAIAEIADTGPGIPPEIAHRIFDPFFSGRSGTGLGLAVCHGIVTDLGGTITTRPGETRGTVMRVELPAAPGED